MKLKQIAANQTVLSFANGTEVFFSYETPVAAFVPGRGYLKTDVKYSRTTSKHVTQWTDGGGTEVPQAEIDGLVPTT